MNSASSERTILQEMIIPNHDFGCDERIYLHYDEGKVFVDGENNEIHLDKYGVISSGTFFNGFSLDKWKKNTSLENISIEIEAEGVFQIHIFCAESAECKSLIVSKKCEINDHLNIELPAFSDMDGRMIFYKVQALSPAKITNIYYSTSQKPNQDVHLGIVITHFNRVKQLNKAVNRLKHLLLSDEGYKEKISLAIVDNSRNCNLVTENNITVIENENYGGSGGFARGLLHFDESQKATHCLFMDDDASCETESIKRTFSFLSFINVPNSAIAGALIAEHQPNHIFEKGAKFDGRCYPLKHGLPIDNMWGCIEAEREDIHINYGGWWYFAFALKDVKHYPFPFFVKGDDIAFSLIHNFNLVTLNGVTSFGEDFSHKVSAISLYLDARNHLINQSVVRGKSRYSALKSIWRMFGICVFSYQYNRARGILLALEDVNKGTRVFKNQLEFRSIESIQKLNALNSPSVELSRSPVELDYGTFDEGRLRKILRVITLNGYLLPRLFLIKSKYIKQNQGYCAVFRHVFRYKTILYVHPRTGDAQLASRNMFLACSLVSIFLFESIKFLLLSKKKYKINFNDISTKKFWKKTYLIDID